MHVIYLFPENNSLEKLIQQVLRFKILHIAYWTYAFVSNVHFMQTMRNDEDHAMFNYIDAFNELAFQMLSVYTTIYFLIPKYFVKEKYWKFAFSALSVILSAAMLNVVVQITYVNLLMPGHHSININTFITLLAQIFNIGVITIVFTFIILVHYYYLKDKRNKEIEKERIVSELDFLKAQINPHFLFNALNSIYVLMKEDIKLSEQTLLKFSSLLRYQLYDCSNNETTLEKEMEFIKNYIALEKVRNGENLTVNLRAPETIPYFPMAPFILIPFVENAFKHISHFNGRPNKIDISFSIEQSKLYFAITNTYDDYLNQNKDYHGIGLQNVKRRLELLYPGSFSLEINKEETVYSVQLKLEQREN